MTLLSEISVISNRHADQVQEQVERTSRRPSERCRVARGGPPMAQGSIRISSDLRGGRDRFDECTLCAMSGTSTTSSQPGWSSEAGSGIWRFSVACSRPNPRRLAR